MSSYSKKYTNLKDDQNHLFLTWETGYKNLKVYYNSQLIQTIDSPGEFRKGVSFDHPELNNVELKFSTGSPIIMQVKANGEKYFPENNTPDTDKNDLSGLVNLFGILAGLAFIMTVITHGINNFQIQNPAVLIQLIFEFLIIGIYAVSAYFIHKQQRWAYFLGSITFILITLLYFYNIAVINFSMGIFIGVAIRGTIIYFILRRYNDVMRITKKVATENYDLLDNSDF